MVEADSYLKLLLESILYTYKVFEHIDMPSIGKRKAAFNSLLGTSLRDTYVMYPYHESHGTRALSSQESQLYRCELVRSSANSYAPTLYTRYLHTMRNRM